MRIAVLMAALLGLCPRGVRAEDVAANPTRPSASDNAFLTAPGYCELELGWSLTDNQWAVPMLAKLAVHERIEVGVGMTGLLTHSEEDTELGDPGVQVKVQWLRRSWGAAAAVGRVDWSNESAPGYTLYAATSYQMPKMLLDTTIGATFFESDALMWAVAVSPQISTRVSAFAELFGSHSSATRSAAVDFGLSFVHRLRLVSDVSLALGLDGDAADWTLQLGFTALLFKIPS